MKLYELLFLLGPNGGGLALSRDEMAAAPATAVFFRTGDGGGSLSSPLGRRAEEELMRETLFLPVPIGGGFDPSLDEMAAAPASLVFFSDADGGGSLASPPGRRLDEVIFCAARLAGAIF